MERRRSRGHASGELPLWIAGGFVLFLSLVAAAKTAGRLAGALSARGIEIGLFAYPLAFVLHVVTQVAALVLLFGALAGVLIAAEWLRDRWQKRRGTPRP